jgi:hypothetical protein
MSTAESTRDMLFGPRASIGTTELEHGGCMVELAGRELCLPPKGGLLNDDCGYCWSKAGVYNGTE